MEPKQNNNYQQEQNQISLTFSHPKIGSRKFFALPNQTLTQYRSILQQTTQMFLFSNFNFQYKGSKLSELLCIGDIIQQKEAQIQIILTTFNYRSAKHHLSKVMDIINCPQFYVYLLSNASQQGNEKEVEVGKNQIPKYLQQLDLDNLYPDLSSRLLDNLTDIQNKTQLLHSISLSGFNPPPTSQRLNGDLFYIHARVLQGQDLHITASPYGFYLNQSKISNFNPNKSSSNKHTYGSLLDLLKAFSEKFRNNFQQILSHTVINDALRYKFQSIDKIRRIKWLESIETEHTWNSKKNFTDTHIKVDLLSLKDWNESFQIEHQLSQQNSASYEEKMAQIAKIYSQFQAAALQGATFLIDGKISPLNPTDDKKKHIYIYNKIFFSIANQTPYDHSQEKGEDATPSSSSINTDLHNIRTLHSLNISDLHLLHTLIVAYRGYKVIAQCIIPGILSVDQINCSQYGSIDDGKTVETNEQFQKIMIKVCKQLHLEDNIIVSDQNNVKKRIAGSPDVKGILGSDKRKYILDLLRISPRDLNYEGIQNQTCVIRKQLLTSFFQGKDKTGLPKLNTNIGTDIKFQKGENFEEQQKFLREIAQYLRNTAIPNLINTLKNSPSQYLTNNKGITKAFHMWGINMRYLGQVCNHDQVKYQPQIKIVLERIIFVRALKHLLKMGMRESSIMHLGSTIVNILNSIFGKKNHLLFMEEGIIAESNNEQNNQKEIKKKKKKKNKEIHENFEQVQKDLSQIINVIQIPVNRFASMKPSQVWQELSKIALARFNYKFPNNIEELQCLKMPFQKIAALKDVCLATGIVLEKKNYDIFESTNRQMDKIPPFSVKNILSLEARSKHMEIHPHNLLQRQRQSEKFIEKYQVKEALKLDTILEKQNLAISGGLNEAAIRLYSRMSKILYILGDNKTAIIQQQKNLNLLDSLGAESDNLIIQSHLNLGLYYIGIGDKERVIYHMKKSLFLMLISFGETSPDLLFCLANLARIYQLNKDYTAAIKSYNIAMKYIEKIHGKYHVKMSFCYASLATISYEQNNLKKAIQYQTQNVGILTQILAENDTRLQDGIKILKMYRQMHQKIQLQSQYFANNPPPPTKPQVKKVEQNQNKKKAKK